MMVGPAAVKCRAQEVNIRRSEGQVVTCIGSNHELLLVSPFPFAVIQRDNVLDKKTYFVMGRTIIATTPVQRHGRLSNILHR